MNKTTTENLIISLLKDFYSDRDIYSVIPSKSPFNGSAEIYRKHAERIYERLFDRCQGTGIGEDCGNLKVENGDFCQFHSDNLPI